MIVIFDELQVVIPIYYCNSSYSFSLKYIAAVSFLAIVMSVSNKNCVSACNLSLFFQFVSFQA
jgi:hypothetical protein